MGQAMVKLVRKPGVFTSRHEANTCSMASRKGCDGRLCVHGFFQGAAIAPGNRGVMAAKDLSKMGEISDLADVPRFEPPIPAFSGTWSMSRF